MDKKEFRELFLALTKYTIPPGSERLVIKYLPNGYKVDSIGNYYYEIGDSDTLFTAHLDTYCSEVKLINHVFDRNDMYKIGTDGSTILGGDNKLGCSILIGMIKDNIPGVYYFFIGEEPILNGGLLGSYGALGINSNFFKKFKRCIAFDRRGYGSIVVRQMGRRCCSDKFVEVIANELKSKGNIGWDRGSGFGYYTDTAVFMDIIPECTNLSAGGFNEHHNNEWVDLNYAYNLYRAVCRIDFESLPVERKLEVRFSNNMFSGVSSYNSFLIKKNFKVIDKLVKVFDLSLTRDIYEDGVRHITISKWLEDYDLDIYLDGGEVIFGGKEVSIDELKLEVLRVFIDDVREMIEYWEKMDENEDKSDLGELLKLYGCKDINEFKKLIG